jgi:hypothetical protein
MVAVGAGIAAAIGLAMPPRAQAETYDTAILRGLDKVTARVSTMPAPVGETVRFGTLEITVRACDKRPPEEQPEAAVFLEIWEVAPREPAVSLFSGWMFRSSPALSAIDHPVYDLWLLDCVNTLATAPSSTLPESRPLNRTGR